MAERGKKSPKSKIWAIVTDPRCCPASQPLQAGAQGDINLVSQITQTHFMDGGEASMQLFLLGFIWLFFFPFSPEKLLLHR